MAINTLDVYTVGGLEYISQVLEAIVLIFGDNTFHSMLKVSLLWGLIIVATIAIARQKVAYPLSFLAVTFFLFHAFFSAKTDVLITDTKTQEQYMVRDVPFGVAFLTSIFSNASYYMTNMIDTAFHTGTTVVLGVNNEYVKELDFKNMGFAGVFDYVMSLKKARPDNPRFVEDYPKIYAYITQCLIPDLSSWTEDEKKKLAGSKDILGEGLLRVKNNLLMEYGGQTWYCLDFYDNQAKQAFDNVVSVYKNNPELFGIVSGAVNNLIATRMPAVINSLTTGQQQLNQLIGNQAVKEALKLAFKSYSSNSQVLAQDLTLAYMKGEAEGRAKLAGKAIGEYAKETIPLLNIVLQFIIIGIMPMVAVAMLLPGGLSIIKNLLYTIAWVYLWTPVLALLDAIVKVSAIAKTNSWMEVNLGSINGVDIAYNLLSADYIQNQAEWMSAIAGFLAISTPGIAWMVLKGSDYTISSLGSRLGGFIQQTATPETISQAIQAERAGFALTGELGHGAEVRSAMWGNMNSIVNSLASHTVASADIGQAYNAGMWSASSSIAQGDKYWGMGGESIAGAKALATAGQREKFLQERAMIALGQSKEWKETVAKQYSQGVNETLNELVSSSHDKSSGFQEFDRITTDTMKNISAVEQFDKAHGTHYAESFKTLKSFQESLTHGLGLSEKDAQSVGNRLFGVLSADKDLLSGLMMGKKEAFEKFKNILGEMGLRFAGEMDSKKVQEWAKSLSDEVKQGITTGETVENLNQLYDKLSKDEGFRKEWSKSVNASEGKGYDYSEARKWTENVSTSRNKIKSLQEAYSLLSEGSSGFQEKIADMFVDYVKDYYRETKGYNLSDADAINWINNARNTEQLRMLMEGFIGSIMGRDTKELTKEGFMEKWENAVDYDAESKKITQEGQQAVEDFSHQGHAIIDARKAKNGILIPQMNAYLYKKGKDIQGEVSQEIGATKTLLDGAKTNLNLKQQDMESYFGDRYGFMHNKVNEGFVDRMKDMFGTNKFLAGLMAVSGFLDTLGGAYNLYKNRGEGTPPHVPHTPPHTPSGKSPNTPGGRTPHSPDIPDAPSGRTQHTQHTPHTPETPHTPDRGWKGRISNIGGKLLNAGSKLGSLATIGEIGAGAATAFLGAGLYFANEAREEGKEAVIMVGHKDPTAYVGDKLLDLMKDGYEYVKDFLGGNPNHQQVKEFQANMYKPVK